MRILIDPSSSHCLNLGDVAMMQVTVRRLRERWPDAEIVIFTEAPELLEMYCPGTRPLDSRGRAALYNTGALFDKVGKRVPALSPLMSEIESGWRQQYPGAAQKLLSLRAGGDGPTGAAAEYLQVLDSCDFSVVSGAGQITTSFKEPAILVLNNLEAAIRRGIPTAIFGQGIGPIDDAPLLARAQKVLPQVSILGLRESLVGPALLDSLGVSKDRYTVTGDDAIEMAYGERPASPGNAIGVNLRVAWYAAIDEDFIVTLRRTLASAAGELQAPLVSVPISRHPEERDQEVAEKLFAGYDKVLSPVNDVTRTEGLMREIGRCRVVITTSYHGGVFSLSQGVPVVAWIKSKYFASKLLGLANQFGVGCTVVSLDEGDAQERLKEAIVSSYRSAENLRPRLLASAEDQIRKSRALYQRAFETVLKTSPAMAGPVK